MNWVKGEGVNAEDVCYAIGLGYIVISIGESRKRRMFSRSSTYGLTSVASKRIVVAW